jgi:hypothetical protein
MPSRTTYTLQEPNGRKFRVAGTGTTAADAKGEADAKLALTVGTLLGGTTSSEIAAGALGAPHAAGVYSDANIELIRASDGKKVSIHLENISDAYGDGVTGDLDKTNADLIAFAAAYRDGSGAGGYTVYGGSFVK